MLDNLATGRWGNLEGLPLAPGARIAGDVRDAPLLARALAGVDAVLHLACRGLRFGRHAPRETHEVSATKATPANPVPAA